MSEVVNGCYEFTLNEVGRKIVVHGLVKDYCYLNELLEKVVLNVYFDIHNSNKFEERIFNFPEIPDCFISLIEQNITNQYPYKSC